MKWRSRQSMLDIVEQTARVNGAGTVTLVRIEIGALSHVEPEALRFCFDVVTRESLADGARLDIRTTPGEAWCMPCGRPCRSPDWARPVRIAAAISSRLEWRCDARARNRGGGEPPGERGRALKEKHDVHDLRLR